MRRSVLWFIIILCVIGMASSLAATHRYFQILQNGFEEKSFCTINAYINCDAAFASSEAKLGGIPVSGLGFVFYLWSAILALWILIKKNSEQAIAGFGWVLALGGLILSCYKAYTAIFVLNILCILCSAMYLVNFLIWLCWHWNLKIGFKNWANLNFKPKFIPLSIGTAIFFAAGAAVMAGYQNKYTKEMDLGVKTDEVVQYHFHQSQYQFNPSPSAPLWGNPDAKVTIVEFSDFQCPFCRHAAFHLKPVLEEFRDKVKFYFYNYPLDKSCNKQIQSDMHDKSCMAAEAATCAAELGNFWDYHDEVFRNQKNLSRELLVNIAKQRGWDAADFEKCIDAPATLAKVQENIEAGNKIYVTGTPTILVNNRRVKYWTNPDVLRAILREEIKRASP